MGQDAAGGSPSAPAQSAGTGGQTDRGAGGDLLIRHRMLLHGSGPNRSDKPRMAQYLNMSPAGNSKEKRKSAIKGWQERRATRGWPGDDRDWEHKYQEPPVLTELGRKLIGVDSWG